LLPSKRKPVSASVKDSFPLISYLSRHKQFKPAGPGQKTGPCRPLVLDFLGLYDCTIFYK